MTIMSFTGFDREAVQVLREDARLAGRTPEEYLQHFGRDAEGMMEIWTEVVREVDADPALDLEFKVERRRKEGDMTRNRAGDLYADLARSGVQFAERYRGDPLLFERDRDKVLREHRIEPEGEVRLSRSGREQLENQIAERMGVSAEALQRQRRREGR